MKGHWTIPGAVGVSSILLALMPWERHGLLASCLGAHPVAPAGFWTGWSLAPEILLPLAALCFGVQRMLRFGGSPWLAAGVLLVAVALVSPLCRLAATLVAAHMVQFMLLSIAAPLLLAPLVVASRLSLGPLMLAYGAAIWIWHLPPVYAAILEHAVVHLIAVAALLGISMLFWRAVLDATVARPQAGVGALLVTMCHTGILGAWLTFATRPWYPFLEESVGLWGLGLLADQQLAGLFMWVAGGAAYLVAALYVCALALRQMQSRRVT